MGTQLLQAAILRTGLRRALRHPQLIFGLWLLSLLTAVVATLPMGLALVQILGRRVLAFPLATGKADYLFVELFGNHPTLGPNLLGSVGLALLLFWLLQTALSGGLTAALLRPGHPAAAPPGRILASAAASATAMFRLELLGLFVLRLPILALFALFAFLLSFKQQLGESTLPWLALRFAPLASVCLLLWSMASVLLHLARAHRLTQPVGSGSARVALRVTLWQLLGERMLLIATLRIGLLSLVGYLALLGVGRLVAARLDYGLFVGSAFLVRQLCGLGRATLSLSVLAATTEAWHHQGE